MSPPDHSPRLFLIFSTEIRTEKNPTPTPASDQSKYDKDDHGLFWVAPCHAWLAAGKLLVRTKGVNIPGE